VPRVTKAKNDESGTWHSQYAQDISVFALLGGKTGGFFIDLASNEPLAKSNTRALERDRGWKGLCIEANPRYWEALRSIRSCHLVTVAVADTNGEVQFVDDDGFSGIVSEKTDHKEMPMYTTKSMNTRHKKLAANFTVKTVPFADILEATNAPRCIDYMSLDVEGAETLVMHSFPFANHTVAVMTIERPKPDLTKMLRSHGYMFLCGGGADEVWVHPSRIAAPDPAANQNASHPADLIARWRAHRDMLPTCSGPNSRPEIGPDEPSPPSCTGSATCSQQQQKQKQQHVLANLASGLIGAAPTCLAPGSWKQF
jgi:FkbM family methyltransferase